MWFRILPTIICLVATQIEPNAAAGADKWDMPLAYAGSNFHSENAAAFGDCISSATAGAIRIVTHPAGSLFKGSDIKRAVQTGQVAIGERILSAHENENPLFGTDSLPFIATSYDDSLKLWQASRPAIQRVLDEQGLTLLYSVPWPPNGFYFTKEVNSVADMAGLKVRSYSSATARIAELSGMLPVQIEAAELSQALASGAVESLITSAATGMDSKVWEHLSYFYLVDAWLPRNYVFVNKGIWQALDDSVRIAIQDCATKAESDGFRKSKEYNVKALAALANNGMKIVSPSDQLRLELRQIGEKMAAEWLGRAGNGGIQILDQYRAH